MADGWIIKRLRLLWTDETAFKTTAATVGRFLFAFIGYLMEQGVIPTGVANGGSRFGLLMIVMAFLVNAGQKNPGPPKVLEQMSVQKVGGAVQTAGSALREAEDVMNKGGQ